MTDDVQLELVKRGNNLTVALHYYGSQKFLVGAAYKLPSQRKWRSVDIEFSVLTNGEGFCFSTVTVRALTQIGATEIATSMIEELIKDKDALEQAISAYFDNDMDSQNKSIALLESRLERDKEYLRRTEQAKRDHICYIAQQETSPSEFSSSTR